MGLRDQLLQPPLDVLAVTLLVQQELVVGGLREQLLLLLHLQALAAGLLQQLLLLLLQQLLSHLLYLLR